MGAGVNESHEDWAGVEAELRAMRASVSGLPAAREFLWLFDEFVEVNELELALESLCDLLLDESTAGVSEEIVARVEMLHGRMKVSDDCVAKMRIKMGGSGEVPKRRD